MLRSQGLSADNINTVCVALVITDIVRSTSMGVFLSAGQCSKIDAFSSVAHKYGFTNRSLTVNELLNTSAADLHQKAKSPTHCLHMLLPPKKSIDYSLGNSDSTFMLPQCKFNIFKRSFIKWCLFNL